MSEQSLMGLANFCINDPMEVKLVREKLYMMTDSMSCGDARLVMSEVSRVYDDNAHLRRLFEIGTLWDRLVVASETSPSSRILYWQNKQQDEILQAKQHTKMSEESERDRLQRRRVRESARLAFETLEANGFRSVQNESILMILQSSDQELVRLPPTRWYCLSLSALDSSMALATCHRILQFVDHMGQAAIPRQTIEHVKSAMEIARLSVDDIEKKHDVPKSRPETTHEIPSGGITSADTPAPRFKLTLKLFRATWSRIYKFIKFTSKTEKNEERD